MMQAKTGSSTACVGLPLSTPEEKCIGFRSKNASVKLATRVRNLGPYLLGEHDRIVGVSGYAVRPPQVRRENGSRLRRRPSWCSGNMRQPVSSSREL